MVKLVSKAPCADLLPRTIGAITMTEVVLERLVSVSPFAGQSKWASAALKDQIGLGLSAPGRAITNRRARVIWAGQRTWLVAAEVKLDGLAAVTDQSDAWTSLRIEGAGVEDVLARLVPIDLRASNFKGGHTARTMLAHMNVTITRVGAQAFEVMAMRSMAETLVHDLQAAAEQVTARG